MNGPLATLKMVGDKSVAEWQYIFDRNLVIMVKAFQAKQIVLFETGKWHFLLAELIKCH